VTYYYKVYVYDTAENGAASNEVNATTAQDQPPTGVSVTSPQASASVGGKHVPVTVTASDETRIYELVLKVNGATVDGEVFGDDGPASVEWTFDWNATSYSGNVTLTVKAYDGDPEDPAEEGEDYYTTTSPGVTVSVSNPNPSVSIVAPLSGDTVAGAAVPVVADFGPTSPSTSGIKKLELFVDSEATAHATKDFGTEHPSQAGRWTLSWDTTGYSNASHTIKVKATDEQSNTTTSATQTVTVDNANNVPPTRVVLDDPYNVTDTTLNLHWSLNEDTDFAKYEVHKSTTQSFTPDANSLEATITTQSSNFYHVEDLSASTTYYFKIKVYDDAGTPLSVVSNEVSASTRSTGNDLPETTVISYTYDKIGRKATMTDPFGTTLYTYNARGELTQVKDPNAKTVAYQYNDGRLRTQMTDQFSGVTGYTYDNANRLTRVTDPDSNQTDYTYDSNGRRTRMDLPNGTYTTYTYSTRNWLTAITHKKSDTSTFLSITYEQDKVANPTKATENNGDVTDYSYDDLYRLTRETKKDSGQQTLYDYSYTYDAVGNRTKKRDEVAQSDTNYTNNNMNQMTAAGNITYTYDDAGNMLTKVVNQETTNYTWDFRNKMLKVDFPSGDDPVMRYDGDGSRVKKVVGATTRKYLYDVTAQVPAVLFETDGSLNEVAEYRRDAAGALVAMERSSTLYWYHFDHLGSTRALTNTSETVTDTYKYDAWGNGTASTGSTTNPHRFVGKLGYYNDPDVGLMLLGARYYDAGPGRFVSLDPAQHGWNWYLYIANSPLSGVDPRGLIPAPGWELPPPSDDPWPPVNGPAPGFLACMDECRDDLEDVAERELLNRLGNIGGFIGCMKKQWLIAAALIWGDDLIIEVVCLVECWDGEWP